MVISLGPTYDMKWIAVELFSENYGLYVDHKTFGFVIWVKGFFEIWSSRFQREM